MSSEISSEKSEEKTIIVGQEIETVIINYIFVASEKYFFYIIKTNIIILYIFKNVIR